MYLNDTIPWIMTNLADISYIRPVSIYNILKNILYVLNKKCNVVFYSLLLSFQLFKSYKWCKTSDFLHHHKKQRSVSSLKLLIIVRFVSSVVFHFLSLSTPDGAIISPNKPCLCTNQIPNPYWILTSISLA